MSIHIEKRIARLEDKIDKLQQSVETMRGQLDALMMLLPPVEKFVDDPKTPPDPLPVARVVTR